MRKEVQMTDAEKRLLIETEQRSKSNTNQIREVKEDIKEIKSEQKAIYDIATSVKLIAQSMDTMKDDLFEVKQGQVNLSHKVDTQIEEVRDGQGKLENKLQERVDCVDTKVDNVRDRTKFDVLDYFMNNVLPWLLGAGALGGVYAFVQNVLK